MARWRQGAGPEWPERLTRFCEWEWSESEILEAVESYAARHAAASGLEEPLPLERWTHLATPRYAWGHFRRRWARENGREDELVDEMVQNRLRRQRRT
jgi:hypothetical protein